MAGEMRFLRNTKAKTRKREWYENPTENVKENTLEDKLINKRIIFYGNVLRINAVRTPKKILNLKLKGKGKSR
jgi:hypothetical protein